MIVGADVVGDRVCSSSKRSRPTCRYHECLSPLADIQKPELTSVNTRKPRRDRSGGGSAATARGGCSCVSSCRSRSCRYRWSSTQRTSSRCWARRTARAASANYHTACPPRLPSWEPAARPCLRNLDLRAQTSASRGKRRQSPACLKLWKLPAYICRISTVSMT